MYGDEKWTLSPFRDRLTGGILSWVPVQAAALEGGKSYAHMGVSKNRGPKYSTLNSRILIIRTPI